MLDIDLLHGFVAIVECGGFTRAAERVGSTQGAMSAKLKRLELAVGRRLVQRTTRDRPVLTPDGEVLFGFARDILKLQHEAESRLATPKLAGMVRLGTSDDFASGRGLTATLSQFARLHREVDLEVLVANGLELLSGPDNGKFDLVVASRGEGSDASGELLWREQIVWAGPKSGARQIVSSETLPVALFPAPCTYRNAALNALRTVGRNWRSAYTSSSLFGIRAAVQAGLAVAPLARYLLTEEMAEIDSSEGLPKLGEAEFFLMRQTRRLSPAAEALAMLLRTNSAPSRAVLSRAVDQVGGPA